MKIDRHPTEIALKPCPFCGGVPYSEASVCDYIIVCRPCGLKMRRNSEHRPEAVVAWNRRVPDPAVLALTEERDALRAALHQYGEHDAECNYHPIVPNNCDCGLNAALRGKEGT